MSEALPNGNVSEDEKMPEENGPDIGTSFTVMKLWEGEGANNRRVWLKEPPQVEEETVPIEESPQYAITLLHKKAKDGGSKQYLETIIMRGQELRKFLEATIPNISSTFNEEEHGLVQRSPFRNLFWHLDYIEAAAQGSDKKLSEVTGLLAGVLREEFRDLLSKRKEMVSKQEINFDTVWTLFKPGRTCVTEFAGDIIAAKVTSITFSRDPMGHLYFRINHNTLAWDGEHFGWSDSYTDIMEYGGRKKIKDLDIYPIDFHDDKGLSDKLIARGKKWVETVVKEPHMMSFNGETLDREASPMWWQGEQKKRMSERVTLDARAYNHYYRRLSVNKWKKRSEMLSEIVAEGSDQTPLLYCCPEFHVFTLSRKKWARVWYTDLEEVAFNTQAYPSLVLPGDYKELLLAFAEAQIDGYGFDDVIAGKGQGILMLLAGPPGTGKTLTAEAMAEHMKRPLYSVSAGELGASPGGMENELDRVFELATRWNAVLLLDEADVFLERRQDNDLRRNSIVSVFLRKLEYYRGIMFLTTNRIGSFDEAFKSRIHVAIRYPDLDTAARRTIWENFLKKTEQTYQFGVEVSSAQLDHLADRTLNGREIRNIVKSAQLLASRTKHALKKSHLDIVWKVEHEDSAWDEVDSRRGSVVDGRKQGDRRNSLYDVRKGNI